MEDTSDSGSKVDKTETSDTHQPAVFPQIKEFADANDVDPAEKPLLPEKATDTMQSNEECEQQSALEQPDVEEQEQSSIVEWKLPAEGLDNQEEPLESIERDEFEPDASSITSSDNAPPVIIKKYTTLPELGNLEKEKQRSQNLVLSEDTSSATVTGNVIEDNENPTGTVAKSPETIKSEVLCLDPERSSRKAIQQECHMPDIITVRVQTDLDSFQDVTVKIERPTYHKPFLGGFKHRITGVEFHNAGSQTVPKKRPDKGIKVFCRETQVVVLQTYFRRWHAINLVQKLREEKRLRLEWEAQEELNKKKEKEEKIRSEHKRRLNPKTKEDYELLYHALESWRQEEMEQFNRTLTGTERKAALCGFLEQETQLIASIGRHKLDADEENQQKAVLRFLDKCAQPKSWKAFDGKITEMDTQYTLRARELFEIYRSISMNEILKDERIDVLLTLRRTVKEHGCKLTQEIVELIDREVDLMLRDVKECNLEGLRKRICTLFLQYIKTPKFNPEVARILKVPPDPLKLYKNVNFCRSCKNYLPSTEFSVPANSRTIGRCRLCCKIDNEARQREEFLKYRLILKNLRESEADYQDDAKIVYLVQQQDLQYMVENIWGCQSALSASDDLYDLVMVRWDKHREWSPWNTILLTKDEADAHLKLRSLQEAYEAAFIHRINHKHIRAKKYFAQIPAMASFLHRSGDQTVLTNEFLIAKPIPTGTKA
ncbi:IQ motif and ubiquitin-like domain-containing protein isoform X2 [Dromaius novaehollandiae]|uniref:IQ motif and ubiquitin-like domain-containing protein isoform X2 n=1 Tax=Dromaius novaehollandiae TaxID=8790 RepID=UPI00311E7DA7